VIQADSDNLESAQAILRGLRRRHQATGRKPIFIHTVRISLSLSVIG